MSLESLVRHRRIIVTLGPGGVGKTTMAAVLGLQAAVLGRRALVLTIDPAMRLADALGLGAIEAGTHHALSIEDLAARGIPARAGMTVSMLDTGASLASLIEREVHAPALRARILQHRFFGRLREDLAGSREYAAMEELYHLYLRGGFDLVVVDTPPTTHSLDFLQAPDKVLDVLDTGSYRWLMRPALLTGKLGLKVLDFSGGYVVRTLSRFTGLDFLRDLASFIDMFAELLEGFRQRAEALKEILRSSEASFVLVTTADPNQADESSFLQRRLESRNLAPDMIIANRVVGMPGPVPPGKDQRRVLIDAAAGATGFPPDRVAAVLAAAEEAHRQLAGMAERDRHRLEQMRDRLTERSRLASVPLLEEDVYDLEGLERMRRAVFAQGGQP